MGTPPISSAMSRGRGLKVLLRTLFPPALCGYLPSLLLYIPIDYYKFEKERHQSME